jgi:hypothetical protein
VRRPSNKNKEYKGESPRYTISPSPVIFGPKKQDPQNLKREISTPSQKDGFEDIILYGHDNALPLRIAQAVEESPAASSCVDTIAKFIKGSGFSDPELMSVAVDTSGTTLWDLHSALSDSLALFWGFAVNFKFNRNGKITNAFQTSFESCRFKEPGEKSPYITHIKYNPYYGTSEYRTEFTKTYPVYNLKNAVEEISGMKADQLKDYPGQIYYYGKTSPLSRFYPKPRYWSAKEAIQADHKIQEFNNEELDNGFFQSVLLNVIGDPNKMSMNPRTMKEELQSDGVTIKLVPTKTVGEEFNEMMSQSFSGSKKAGTAMVLWSLNSDTAVKVSEFPTGITGERLIATQDSVTKTITIAFQVPSILANISEGVSLGSGGSEIQKAIELMQSRTVEWREVLQNFYNNILLPNLEKKVNAKVEIQNYNPISEPIDIDDKIWEFLNEAEKVAFIKKNMPEIEIIRTATPTTEPAEPETDTETGEPLTTEAAPAAPKPNEALKSLNMEQINKIQKIVARYNLSINDPSNSKALTYEQAKQFLRSYGLQEEELDVWLVKPEEI